MCQKKTALFVDRNMFVIVYIQNILKNKIKYTYNNCNCEI